MIIPSGGATNPIYGLNKLKSYPFLKSCMMEDESVLEQKLNQFKGEMLAKFRLRADKWGKDSVTRDDFDWRNYPLESIQDRFLHEITERFPDHDDATLDETKEDVDIANMAFLDWAVRKARATASRHNGTNEGRFP